MSATVFFTFYISHFFFIIIFFLEISNQRTLTASFRGDDTFSFYGTITINSGLNWVSRMKYELHTLIVFIHSSCLFIDNRQRFRTDNN